MLEQVGEAGCGWLRGFRFAGLVFQDLLIQIRVVLSRGDGCRSSMDRVVLACRDDSGWLRGFRFAGLVYFMGPLYLCKEIRRLREIHCPNDLTNDEINI